MTIMAKINNKTHTGRKKAGLVSDTKGLSTVEYLILLTVIAVASISLWRSIGGKVKTHATESDKALGNLTVTQ